ncbi:MAG: transporter [Planctomycetia bacterium]
MRARHLRKHLLLSFVAWAIAAAALAEVPLDPAITSPRPWTRFLAEAFPEGIDPERSREPLTIRDPGPDTANYPNGPNTLPRGGVYLELSPAFYTGAITTVQQATYSAEFLLRMGLTDRFECRVYSSGFTWQAAGLGMGQTTGFSPLVFDTKMHLWEENEEWFIPAAGFESFVQTPWGSPAFDSGTIPGLMMLFRNTLWWGLVAEYNVGISDDSTQNGYQPVDIIQWAITKELTDDFQVLVHGFQNQSALPRLVAQTVVSDAARRRERKRSLVLTEEVHDGVGDFDGIEIERPAMRREQLRLA